MDCHLHKLVLSDDAMSQLLRAKELFPTILTPVTDSHQDISLEERFWRKQCEVNPSFSILDFPKSQQPISSYSRDVVTEVFNMLSVWRKEAESQVATMSQEEREKILRECGVESSTVRHNSKIESRRSVSRITGRSSSVDSSTSHSSVSSPQRDPAARLFSRHKLKRCHPSSRSNLSKGQRKPSMKSRDDQIDSETNDDDEEEEEDEEEDQLTKVAKRQREASAARLAAGRPSARLNKTSEETQGNVDDAVVKPSKKVLLAWKNMARKFASKTGRQWQTLRREKINLAKRAARECYRVMRQKATASQKLAKEANARARRLSRELATHWRESLNAISSGTGPLVINGIPFPDDTSVHRSVETSAKNDASSSEAPTSESAAAIRRRAEKAAAEQRKADMELLEARRQQRKLNFLITQTELYAHFMARKMDTTPVPGQTQEIAKDTAHILRRLEMPEDSHPESDSINGLPDSDGVIPQVTDAGQASGRSIAEAAKEAARRLGVKIEDEFDVDTLKSQALCSVRAAVDRERDRVSDFTATRATTVDVPSTDSEIKAPNLFQGQLKAYQLRGLSWLLGLFDQGINGILADEMGLGKTVQTVAFFGHLAERYDIWGPFLIVAPASTLHNWTQEFAKFLPAFRIVPYWGSPAERKVLRRFGFNPSAPGNVSRGVLGTESAEMHVVVTSYQIVIQDAKFLNRISWAYIILDEAHAIKSTSSLRWRVLLSFKCRNRLLLTGTPIQNTMQELWALLHFIMPTLFDSHDEFANWFSRDIETQVTSSSGTTANNLVTAKLNENQLSRLHLILKPFMLRRTKAEVEHEIAPKIEILRYCQLSSRQQRVYNRLRHKICFEDLNSVIGRSGDEQWEVESSTAARLINLVMQLRKVCNHPDLWDPRETRFTCVTGSIQPSAGLVSKAYLARDHMCEPYFEVPRLFYEDDLIPEFSNSVSSPSYLIGNVAYLPSSVCAVISRLFALYDPFHIDRDMWSPVEEVTCQGDRFASPSFTTKCFSFVRLLGLSPGDIARWLRFPAHTFANLFAPVSHVAEGGAINRPPLCIVHRFSASLDFWQFCPQFRVTLPCSQIPNADGTTQSRMCSPLWDLYVPKVTLTPLNLYVRVPYISALQSCSRYPHRMVVSDPSRTPLDVSIACSLPLLDHVRLATRVYDSGKLVALDVLLHELKPAGHRVLIYSQMTKMIDILEELMIYRKHNYLRLDGSSRLCDRRDMVAQWQSNSQWFVFLLSTRAGGLGINLTAADTVIFYDSDWNPTVDQQAMDRAHRLGQTKPVTVYRLVCKNTIEERMMQRAEQKRAMQQMVIQSRSGVSETELNAPAKDQLTSSDMVSLLLDDDELVERLEIRKQQQTQRGRPAKLSNNNVILANKRPLPEDTTTVMGNIPSNGKSLPLTENPEDCLPVKKPRMDNEPS